MDRCIRINTLRSPRPHLSISDHKHDARTRSITVGKPGSVKKWSLRVLAWKTSMVGSRLQLERDTSIARGAEQLPEVPRTNYFDELGLVSGDPVRGRECAYGAQ